jgi:tRNA1Val (adenine37-N6)-methyltransferase
MKVCTDACLFGALLPPNPLKGECHVLDIGAGTGLLSLMVAQKSPLAEIDAVEIDAAAAEQANENFKASPWHERLHIFNSDVLHFTPAGKYDLILSNPPFYEDDLRSPQVNKNDAKHSTALNLTDLLKVAEAFLSDDGVFAVLLPYQRVEYFIREALKFHLYLNEKVSVSQTEFHGHFRGILFFSREKVRPEIFEISIKDNEGKYTNDFASALKDYYLYL